MTRYRTLHLPVLTIALLMIFLSQLLIFRNPESKPVYGYVALMVMGGILFTVISRPGLLNENSTARTLERKVIDPGVSVQVIWLTISLALSAFTAWRSTLKPAQAYLGEHLIVWVLSMVALVLAFRCNNGKTHFSESNLFHRWEYGLVLVLTVAAFGIRVINLDSQPYLLDLDEAVFALDGVNIRQAHFLVSPFEPGVLSHPYVYQAMIGISTGLFGETLLGARLPSAILGTLGIPALYLLGRELLGTRGGAVAAVFMLTWPFHVHFSRLTLNQPGDPLFVSLAFYFLLRGLKGNLRRFIFSGISLGVAQLFYLGGRLAPLIMIAYLFFLWLRQREVIAPQWRRILIVPLAAFVVALPQNYYIWRFSLPLTTRAWPSVLLNEGKPDLIIPPGTVAWKGLDDQVSKSFLALFSTPDSMAWYGPSSNLMGPAGGPLLLIGFIVSIVLMWKQPHFSLAVGWGSAVILLGSTLTFIPPQYQRYFPGTPAFSLLVAIGLLSIVAALSCLSRQPHIYNPLLQSLGMFLLVINLIFYLVIFVPEHKYLATRFNQVTNRVAHEMLTATLMNHQVVLVVDPQLGGVSESGKSFIATGVDNTAVVRYFMTAHPYIAVASSNPRDWLTGIDTNRPFTYIIPLTYSRAFQEFQTGILPGGNPFLVRLAEDGGPAFYLYRSAPAKPG